MNLFYLVCNDGSNPCRLDNPESPNSYFLPKNGYFCLDAFNGQIICTCPDNSTTRDRPCRKFAIFFSIPHVILFFVKEFVIEIQIHVELDHQL
jgi:hypothetical protein